MSTCSGFCRACNQIVKLVLDETTKGIAVPALTTAAGTAIGATGGKRDRWKRAAVGGAIGFAAGALLRAVTPAVQKWVCGDCGCDDVMVS